MGGDVDNGGERGGAGGSGRERSSGRRATTTDKALKQMQQIMAQSTVWFEANMESINGGDFVTAASLDDGLSDKVLLQLVYEIQSALKFSSSPSTTKDDDDDDNDHFSRPTTRRL